MAELGEDKVEYNLGSLYEEKKEYGKAKEWYSKAAKSGNKRAIWKLKEMKVRE